MIQRQQEFIKKPFEAVVQDHGATVLRVCRAVLALHDADDAWSDTFLAALQSYPELPADANVQAWLVTIAHRKCIDHLRAGNRRPVPTDTPPEQSSRWGIPGEGHRELMEAVAQLPPKQRQAVAYHHIAGLPYAEIAGLLEVTPEAARRAASDGVKALRKTLGTVPQSIPSVVAHSSSKGALA